MLFRSEQDVSEEDENDETYESTDEMDEEDESTDENEDETYESTDEMDEEDDLDLESVIAELEAEMADEGEHEGEEEMSMDMGSELDGEEEAEEMEAEEDGEEEEIDLDEVIRTLKEMEESDDVSETDEMDEEDEDMQSELEEAYSTIESLQKTINEVNLLNAKLLYTNKLFRTFDLNEGQKVKVLENFDRTSSVREVKLVFSTLAENLNVSKKKRTVVKEGYASKATKSSAPKKIISEGNEDRKSVV